MYRLIVCCPSIPKSPLVGILPDRLIAEEAVIPYLLFRPRECDSFIMDNKRGGISNAPYPSSLCITHNRENNFRHSCCLRIAHTTLDKPMVWSNCRTRRTAIEKANQRDGRTLDGQPPFLDWNDCPPGTTLSLALECARYSASVQRCWQSVVWQTQWVVIQTLPLCVGLSRRTDQHKNESAGCSYMHSHTSQARTLDFLSRRRTHLQRWCVGTLRARQRSYLQSRDCKNRPTHQRPNHSGLDFPWRLYSTRVFAARVL